MSIPKIILMNAKFKNLQRLGKFLKLNIDGVKHEQLVNLIYNVLNSGK